MNTHITCVLSQWFGRFADKEFPAPVQRWINRGYVRLMGLDMREFERPEHYASLNALFTRRLKTDRDYSIDADDFISPCDALITDCGEMLGNKALQIKGMQYSVDALLGEEVDKEHKQQLRHGDYVNLYLSPRDYHRYHIPTNVQITKAVHIPGKLYPVNLPSLRKRLDLFVENERVVIECRTQHGGLFYMVLVGALNVGRMRVAFEPAIRTNASATRVQAFSYESLYMNKGDDLGCFEMGSTIVLLAQKGVLELKVAPGEDVRYGQSIATMA